MARHRGRETKGGLLAVKPTFVGVSVGVVFWFSSTMLSSLALSVGKVGKAGVEPMHGFCQVNVAD